MVATNPMRVKANGVGEEVIGPYAVRFIDLGLLRTDASYQRSIRPDKVKAIAGHFDDIAAGVLVVNEREPGTYYVLDGNHRLAAMRQLGRSAALCSIYRSLTQAQEAERFCICNTQRSIPKAQDIFRAQLLAGSPTAMAIEAIVAEHGWVVDLQGHGARTTGITAVAALTSIYTNGGAPRLNNVLRFVKSAWRNDKDAVRGQMLRGISVFLAAYKDVDLDVVALKMRLISPAQVLQDAALLAGHYRGSVTTHIARRILDAFNKSKRTQRLPDLFQSHRDELDND